MNRALADFLLGLLADPERLRRFNTEEGRAQILEQDLTLMPGDRTALLSADSADVLRQLQVAPGEEEELMWVIAPGIKPTSTIGWGIKGPGIKGGASSASTRRRPAKARAKATFKSRKSSGARKSTANRSRKSTRPRGKR